MPEINKNYNIHGLRLQCKLTSCNSDFNRIVRYCKFIIAINKIWDKVTITLYPLYSKLEIIFHRFHLFKRKKLTNLKSAQSKTRSHSFILPLLTVNFLFFLSLSNSVLFCIHKTNSNRSFLLYVVDVMKRTSTPDYSSNWDWNQLFLNISVLYYIKVLLSCYNILYRDFYYTFELLL